MSVTFSAACIKYVPSNPEGVTIVPYTIIYSDGRSYIKPSNFTVTFVVSSQKVLDYISNHGVNCLSVNFLFFYNDSIGRELRDIVGISISSNTLSVIIDGNALNGNFFYSRKTKSYFRLGVKIGDDEIISDYVPLLPGVDGNAIIEYITEDGKEMCGFSMSKSAGVGGPYDNDYVDGKGQIRFNYIEDNYYLRNYMCYFRSDDRLKSVKFVTPVKLRDMQFKDCPILTSVDLSNVNTEKMTEMTEMFVTCKSLRNLDLSNFITTNVTNMSSMFSGCSGLITVNLSNFDTKNVTNMSSMFSGCSGLTTVNLSNFDTRNVVNMGLMFSKCSSLAMLDLSGFDTRAVYDMHYMFSGCSHLTDLDLSSFNTWNVLNMEGMFKDCSELKSLNLSSFETWKVYNMYEMFSDCKSLTNLDLSYFDTKNVSRMSSMFKGCSSLTSLDLSSFDTGQVIEIHGMFKDCSGLISLNLSGFDMRNVSVPYMRDMFDGCTNLKEIIMRGCNKRTIEKISEVKPKGAVIITD